METFDIQWNSNRKCPVILLKGDITGDSSDRLQAVYEEIKNAGSSNDTLIFDFNNSRYINSSGISSLIRILHIHQERNGRFIFTGLTEHMLKVLDIVGLTEYVTICDSIDSAFDTAKE
jgi:anti-anti-sigma factor